MTEHKLKLLEMYLEVTKQMVQLLDHPDCEDELSLLFDERDRLISQVNMIDQKMGTVLKNAKVTDLLEQIKVKDSQLTRKLTILKEEAAKQLYTIKQAKELKDRYNAEYESYDGAFYDKKQ